MPSTQTFLSTTTGRSWLLRVPIDLSSHLYVWAPPHLLSITSINVSWSNEWILAATLLSACALERKFLSTSVLLSLSWLLHRIMTRSYEIGTLLPNCTNKDYEIQRRHLSCCCMADERQNGLQTQAGQTESKLSATGIYLDSVPDLCHLLCT